MSTNKPSNDQPDKASDFDDELGVPSYNPSTDAKPDASSKAPSSEPTLSFNRPTQSQQQAAKGNSLDDAKLSDAPTTASASPVSKKNSLAATSKESSAGAGSESAGAAAGAVAGGTAAGGAAAAASEPKRSSVFDRPGRAQPQEITPNNTPPNNNQAPQSPVESQPTETMNLGPTTGSQNNSYDDRDFANRNDSFANDPTTVSPAVGNGYEPTTVQPAAAPATAGVGAGAGAGAASAQQFDTPSQYSDETAMALDADTAAAAQAEEEKALRRQYGKRGTIDFGLLFIRIALGGFLIIEGVRTLFSIGESAGISGLESEYASYTMANILAMGVPVGQLVAGTFLVLGLLTPFASMLALVVTGFMAIHELAVSGTGLDVFAWPESLWLALILFVVNVGVQFTGPGFISVDSALGVKALSSPARRPLASSWIFFILGAAALVAVWWFGAGINPLS
ncbi:DoxX family protein [Corynebacteriaceae bacterium 6-324]